MTAPRRILSNATLMLTRRCLNRMFLLRPSERSNQLFSYILAVAAQKYGIALHAFCVLSNHFHLVLTDPDRNAPAFMQYLCGLVARSFNEMHGTWETFFAPGSYSAVSLTTPADVLGKVAYVLGNPAASALVPRGSEWPGLWSAPAQIGGSAIEVERPEGFFRAEGPMPRSATLGLVCPPGFESVEAFRQQLVAELTALENRAAQQVAEADGAFLGARKVLAQRPQARPASVEPRRGLNPRIACQDKWKRIEAIGRLAEFLAAYRVAWRAFRDGVHDTVFPHGTYWMRIAHGACCAAAG